MFYSAQALGFYDAEIHGARRITIIDPAWIRPTVDIVVQPGESAWVGDEQVTNIGDEPMTFPDVPDMDAIPDTLEVDNPACLIPADAVEIPQERHAELLNGQSIGLLISSGEDGYPVLIDPPPPSPEEQAATERVWRDALLSATDGVVTRHRDEVEEGAATTLTTEQYSELLAYRRQLRDWPQGAEFPLADHRPIEPSWLGGTLQI